MPIWHQLRNMRSRRISQVSGGLNPGVPPCEPSAYELRVMREDDPDYRPDDRARLIAKSRPKGVTRKKKK